jgi:hypothetical protein
MTTPPATLESDESLFDSAQPFKGVVVCCTSIPTELRVGRPCSGLDLFVGNMPVN